jgi:hypothetical protein
VCVLPILVGLKGQFSNPIEDLLLHHGLHPVAGFGHVCLCLGGFCDLWGRAWAVENCNDNNKRNRVCHGELRILGICRHLQSPYATAIATAAFNAFSVSNSSFISIALGNGDGVEISIRPGKRWQQIGYSWSILLI